MATYKYTDFENAAKKSGLYDSFSQADLALAKKNPDAGMSILKYKQDYMMADSDAARAEANAGAEQIRSSYGNYTGGADGGSFHLNPLAPSEYTAGMQPTYESAYRTAIDALLAEQEANGQYTYHREAPTYVSRYDTEIANKTAQAANPNPFTYDLASDPAYAAYRKQYTREGKRATEDAIGAAAAATGGIASSYAATAAGQAGDYYAAQLSDRVPELYQLAYDRYLNEYDMLLRGLDALRTSEQSDYGRYQDALTQYNTDRAFDYAAWRDAGDARTERLGQLTDLEKLAYQQYLGELEQYNENRAFDYGQLLDRIDHQTQLRNETLERAELAASYGDYSALEALGIDTSQNQRRSALEEAQIAAKYGDTRLLRALGIDTSTLDAENKAKIDGNKISGDAAGIEMSQEVQRVLQKAAENDYVITDPDDWQILVQRYGSKTLSESALRYEPKSAKEEEKKKQEAVEAWKSELKQQERKRVETEMETMVRRGATREEKHDRLRQLRDSGVIDTKIYLELLATYGN